MILLLTRENSTYDSGTKTFWFNMDKQLDEKVKHLRFQTFSFTPSTVASFPHGILVCSKTLSNLSMRQHVSVLKDTGHRNDTDVIACLHKENHNTTNILYSLSAPLSLTLDRRSFISKLDLYFTDMAGVRLDGDYVPESTAGPNLEDIESEFDAGNILFFMDADLASSYTKTDGTVAVEGDPVKQWAARFPDDASVVFNESSVDGMVLTTFEDETHLMAVTQNPSGGAWESMVDTDLGFDLPSTGSIFMLWETDSTQGAFEHIMNNAHWFHLNKYSGKLQLKHGSNSAYQVIIQNITASTSYLIEVKWSQNTAGAPYHTVDTTINLTKLVVDNMTDYTGSFTMNMRDNGSKRRLELSSAQSGMDSLTSSVLCMTGDDATLRATCKDYLVKRWKNQTTTPVVDPDAVSSTWLSEIRY